MADMVDDLVFFISYLIYCFGEWVYPAGNRLEQRT